VDVPGAAGVESRQDRLQLEPARLVGELVAAQPVAGVVVEAGVVALPEVEQGAGNRLAGGVVDVAADY
jgi:hypothetical protein